MTGTVVRWDDEQRPARELAGVPFRRGCRQMPRSGRLADRADPADVK